MKNSFINLVRMSLVVLALSSCQETSTFYSNVLRSDVFVSAYSDSRYDFLWVMDNSGSMKPRRDFVRDNLQGFLDTLNSRKAIDFQMAVTTTDMFTGAGNLVANPSGLTVVKSASSSNPIADFASVMDSVVDTNTGFWEQGLESSYQAIFKHGPDFMRPGVPLIIVYMTDEDDYSCADHCWGVEPEHNPDWQPFGLERYVDYFKTVKNADGGEVVMFPIVATSLNQCAVSSLGTRYISVMDQLGSYGTAGSICDQDLRDSYDGIAKTIADRGTVFKLANPASGKDIAVYVDSVLVPYSPSNYIYDATQNAIVFTGYAPKKGSIIQVSYAQNVN